MAMTSILPHMLRRWWQVVALLALTPPLEAEGAEANFTGAGCQCKTTWTETDGHECKDACSTLPGQDGKWCMAEDAFCVVQCCSAAGSGDSSVAGSGESSATPQLGACADQEHWHDSQGDSCRTYADFQWCTVDGKAGTGWHERWGDLKDLKFNGYSALTACCACGGGRKGLAAVPTLDNLNAARFTNGGCRCRENWTANWEVELPCRTSCCNSDSDPAGSWCIVEDITCEGAVWGYCRSEDANIDANHGSDDIPEDYGNNENAHDVLPQAQVIWGPVDINYNQPRFLAYLMI